MIGKNKEKEERKSRRKPPVPYSRKEPTKKQRLNREMKERDRNRRRKGWEED